MKGSGISLIMSVSSFFLLIFFLYLFFFFQGLGSDTVQISLTVLGDSSTTLWRDLDDTDLFQSLQDSSVNGTRSVTVVRWSSTSALSVTVQLVQLTDTDLLSQVDVSGNRSGTLVEPTLSILWWHFVTSGSLDDIHVTWNFQLTLSLQERSVSVDEILGSNVSVKILSSSLLKHLNIFHSNQVKNFTSFKKKIK